MSDNSKGRIFSNKRELLITVGICAFLMLVTTLILRAMGRPLIHTEGYVKLWHGVVKSSENSQHISDWYSFSHIVHGFLFFFLLWLISKVFPNLRKVSVRLVLAVAMESAWEILENTTFIINRYREATIALDYFGDSIINSNSDILCMGIGFLIAARLPALISASIATALELLLLIVIRDNLTLNIIMLLWPIKAIKEWQIG